MTFSSFHSLVPEIKSIAVIGAGPCGAGTTKALLAEKKFDKIKVYERRSDFGGLWNYNTFIEHTSVPGLDPKKETKPFYSEQKRSFVWPSAVYDLLDTNVPSVLMAYANTPWPKHLPIFPLREDVLEYMKSYSEPIRGLVEFDTKVIDIRRYGDSKWKVTSRPINSFTQGGLVASDEPGSQDKTEDFDAVAIATGNYDVPYIPDQEGLADWNAKYPGSVIHSKTFKHPSDYTDEKILIIGNSASAADLAFQLATHLNTVVYKSVRSINHLAAGQDERIVDVAEVERYEAASKSVILKDGTRLEGITKVIFATGFLKSIPFLNEINKSDKPLITNGARVEGLYQQVISYNYPGLAVIGLPRFILPTRTAETQGIWLARIWSGRLQLPPIEEMANWEQEEIKKKGKSKKFHDLIFPDDVIYSNHLNKQVYSTGLDLGLAPVVWDKEQTVFRGAVKNIKEAYIAYKKDTGKLATTVKELEDSGYLKLPDIDVDFLSDSDN